MVLGYHKHDYAAIPSDDAVMEALRKFGVPRVTTSGKFEMGKLFGQWFAYTVLISAFAAFLAVHAVGAGASFRRVFHVVGLTTFASCGLALWPLSIWYQRKWATTLRTNLDALIFAVLTGAIFGWLWPR